MFLHWALLLMDEPVLDDQDPRLVHTARLPSLSAGVCTSKKPTSELPRLGPAPSPYQPPRQAAVHASQLGSLSSRGERGPHTPAVLRPPSLLLPQPSEQNV